MSDTTKLSTAIDLLGTLSPPKVCLHIGAGGQADPKTDIALPKTAKGALLIEADRSRFERLAERFKTSPTTRVVQAAIAVSEQSQPFYSHSIDAEGGFLKSESLRVIWPNLKPKNRVNVTAQSLERVFQASDLSDLPASSCNWLIIGCLTADDILDAVSSINADLDVVILRLVLPGFGSDANGLSSGSYEMVSPKLAAMGLLEVAHDIERNGKIGRFVYARDGSKRLARQAAEKAAAIEALTAKHAENMARVQSESEALSNDLALARNARDSALEKADRLGADLTERTQQLEAVKAEKVQAAADLKTQVDQTASLQQKLDAAGQNLKAKEVDRANLQTKLTNASKAGEEKSAELQRLRQKLNEARSAAANAAEEHDADRKAATMAAERQKTQNAEALKTAQDRAEALQRQLTEARAKLGEVSNARDGFRSQVEANKQANAHAEELQKQLDARRAEIETLKTANKRLEADIAASKTVNEQRQAEIEEIKRKLSNASKSREEFKSQMELDRVQANNRMNEIRSRLDARNAEVETLSKANKTLQAGLAEAKEALRRADQRRALSDNNLEATRGQYEVIASKLLARDEQFVALGAELRRILNASNADQANPRASTATKRRSRSKTTTASSKR